MTSPDTTIAHYAPEHRRMILISTIPAFLTALFSFGGSTYLIVAPFGERPPVSYWLAVAFFVIFTAAISFRVVMSVMRARQNHLRVDADGITFEAWQSFTLQAAWSQVQTVERRANQREEVTVLILEEATLVEKPLARTLQRDQLAPPYSVVLDRFEGWPAGALYDAIATHIPAQLERSDA